MIARKERDPKRIDEILDLLKTHWHNHPDLRLCQLIWAIVSSKKDPFYLEDNDFERLLKKDMEIEED